MGYLLLASLLFSFSFGLIGRYLGEVDPVVVSVVRLGISSLVFLPFLRVRRLGLPAILRLAGIGAVQYGLMYISYIYAFRYLAGHEVALLTVVTPLYVTLLYDWRSRRFHSLYLAAALLAVVGGMILTGRRGGGALQGIFLIQVSNICFAAGQVEYKLFCLRRGESDHGMGHFALLYLGGTLLAGMTALLGGHTGGMRLSAEAWYVLLYLGLVPSALGFYFWNQGARKVNGGVLAACNNIKIPLAILVSLVVFGEKVNGLRLGAGVVLMLVALVATRFQRTGSGG